MKGDKNVDNVSNFLSIKLYQDIAQYVLDTGSYTFGIGYNGIDSLTIFINSVKEKFGIFDREVKEFVDFLENKNIIDKVFYIEANAINPQIDGFAYDCEVSIQRIKSFIKNGININEKNIEPSLEKIKSLRLDEKNRLIEINKGERIISFKSRKKEEDSGDEEHLRELRFAPKGMTWNMGYWMYENRVAFLSSEKEGFGFVIHSKEFAQMMRLQFEQMWKVSKPRHAK
jgi:hypothetical protein